jgi:hypothetical protein
VSDHTETSTAARIGFWSGATLFVVNVAYAGVLVVGVARTGLSEPIVDPILAVMEVLTVVAALLFVVLIGAIHGHAPPGHRTLSLLALVFAAVMAGLTSAVHFVALSAGRQLGTASLVWPSVPYAVELLAWDVFLGLSLLSAAPIFGGSGLERATGWAMGITGTLCLLGIVGPSSGEMGWQVIGIVGYAVALPVVCLLSTLVFRRALKEAGR